MKQIVDEIDMRFSLLSADSKEIVEKLYAIETLGKYAHHQDIISLRRRLRFSLQRERVKGLLELAALAHRLGYKLALDAKASIMYTEPSDSGD